MVRQSFIIISLCLSLFLSRSTYRFQLLTDTQIDWKDVRQLCTSETNRCKKSSNWCAQKVRVLIWIRNNGRSGATDDLAVNRCAKSLNRVKKIEQTPYEQALRQRVAVKHQWNVWDKENIHEMHTKHSQIEFVVIALWTCCAAMFVFWVDSITIPSIGFRKKCNHRRPSSVTCRGKTWKNLRSLVVAFAFVRCGGKHSLRKNKPREKGNAGPSLASSSGVALLLLLLLLNHSTPPLVNLLCASMIIWTTDGSASVVMSPSSSLSLAATLRRMRRMILPERVFGNPGQYCNHQKSTQSHISHFPLHFIHLFTRTLSRHPFLRYYPTPRSSCI